MDQIFLSRPEFDHLLDDPLSNEEVVVSQEHLQALEQLRQSIGLRAYGQKDPLNEYKREAFILFEQMLQNLRTVITSVLSHLVIKEEQDQNVDIKTNNNYIKNTNVGKIPRNAKCPCGSEKKYKHCCGK